MSGCAAIFPIDEEMRSWKGAHIDELLAHVGPPTYVRNVGIVKTYEWEEDNGGTYSLGDEVRLRCTRSIAVDSKEIISSWNWTGTGCNASPTGKWKRPALQ